MDFNQLFEGWGTMESIAIFFFLLVAFMFGFLVAYLLRSVKIKRLKKELDTKKKQLSELEAQLAPLQEQLALRDADLKKAEFELKELEAKAIRLKGEKNEVYLKVEEGNASIEALNEELEKARAANRTYVNTIEDLNNQILGLKAKNNQLSNDLEEETETTDSLAQMQSIYNATRNRLDALENKINRLEEENQNLKSEMTELKETGQPVLSRGIAAIDTDEPLVIADINADGQEVEKQEEPEEFIPDTDKTVISEKIIVDEPEDKDDLTKIHGIGPFIEKQLNRIGIYRYQEISTWNDQRIEQVTQDIAYFPGRIKRDDWVGQAKKLLEIQEENPGALEPAPNYPSDPTDLKVVEGIGPKIEQLLKDAGLYTWHELADASSGQLHDILMAAGDHYRVHDPSTWPNQARLAASGEWELLNEYQEELKGGREVKD